MKKTINIVDIDQSDLSTLAQVRNLKVNGDVGSVFTVNVIKLNGTSKESYYDFISKTFTDEFTSKNNLNVTLVSNNFIKPIKFAADTNGETYKILVLASEVDDTSFSDGSRVNVKEITQVGTTTVSIEVDNGKMKVASNANKYTADPPASAVTSTGSTTSTSSVNVPITFVLTNANNDTHGLGLRLPTDIPSGSVTPAGYLTAAQTVFSIPDTYFYSAIVRTTTGSTSSSTTVTLTSVENLAIGMQVGYYDNTVLASYPTITAINGNVVTLSSALSISDNVGVQFRAYGPQLIRTCFGYTVEFKRFIATGDNLFTTVRTTTELPASSGSVTIPVNGTRGISVGARFFGLNVNENSNNNVIQLVSSSEDVGSITIEDFAGNVDNIVALNVTAGSELLISGSNRVVTVTGTVVIKSYPESDFKVKLDLNKFITHGSAS
tara:strand:+ start:1530 stop:2837 length:1308 start_codon:yes stop_codon:yes gene_type:complete